MRKLYCKVQFDHGTTLVRVDNVKEFVSAFPPKELLELHFEKQLKCKAQDAKYKPEPYTVNLVEEDFVKLVKVIKSKLGVNGEILTNHIEACFNSHSYPVYRINRS